MGKVETVDRRNDHERCADNSPCILKDWMEYRGEGQYHKPNILGRIDGPDHCRICGLAWNGGVLARFKCEPTTVQDILNREKR